MLSVTLKRIEHAVAVHDHGGVALAARALNVSQPSISVSIAQLEQELGRALFIRRKGQGIKLTSFGSEFIRDAKGLLGQARILMDARGTESGRGGQCTIGCFEDLAPFHLAEIIHRLRQEHPALQISCEVNGFDSLARDLEQGELDVALTYDLGLNENMEKTILAVARPYALVAAEHPAADRASISLKELARDPLILTRQELSWQHILDLFKSNNIEPRIGLQAGSFELQRSLVASQLGVAVCYARPQALMSYDGKHLRALPISDALPEQRILLAHNRANPPTAATQLVMRLIAETFSEGA